LTDVVFARAASIDARMLLNLIDHLPSTSVTSGAAVGAAPGWSSSDELSLALLNQSILQRRMWADERDAHQLEPIRMPWHVTRDVEQQPMSTTADTRAFFGASSIRRVGKD
jgi:hypothetical protein